jgi:hypothetical protein
MPVELDPLQRAEDRDQGKLTGADGRSYARRGTKMKRSVADEVVASGAPLVLDMWSSGQLDWFDGEEAATAWDDVRAYVISADPTTKQLLKHEMWNAGQWESDDGKVLLYLTGHC